ncbi:bifunctional adenosylcobinamide kinase/adenosylcobinamide-phosphate guanylyltransferase [Tahibacter amnicola]|uniref:Bifunctional adenosylcobalamin biosynthesis protein n=1 Tax=Tahibacter amnicola TaxID=2976241 RepID=A0ABY6B9L1_9GAMM|nr:bifunctional adenosylcobinamide kinase/adenosylcobinamide-phosphate guanylyltransferase [Tahibacter amnicola]UXI66539.1 bifunctional adenosylcobinamide kinase/adenosylcobinamide-phosphate guanylyltransferase [Tahibacter amnicola]
MHTLILGGARSGKSRHAELLAQQSGAEVRYIATCVPGDAEMAERVAHHRARRPAEWAVIEEPIALGSLLRREADTTRFLLVDCLTLWLSNLLCHRDPHCFARERQSLLDALSTLPGTVLFVSNEVGQGIVPMGELSRRFVDEAGRLHQDIAACVPRVIFTIAGIAVPVKPPR